MKQLPYFYAAALVPIGLLWAALQDFVTNAKSPEERGRVRRAAQLIAVIGLAHPGIALIGFDMVRTVDADEARVEPTPERRRVTRILAASFVVSFAFVAWLAR